MQSESTVEIADRISRKRAQMTAFATGAFLVVQVGARPFFIRGSDVSRLTQIFWAINVVALLLVLATRGGLVYSRRLRPLVDDEVSRSNYKTAVVAGYWVAMVAAMAVYLLQSFRNFTGQEAVYIIVSSSVVVALFAFSYLEFRAHRDA
jgi:hypothetical protein